MWSQGSCLCARPNARAIDAGFIVWGVMMQCVFLDEFGHDGFYEPRSTRYGHSPVFGLGGIIVPGVNVPRLVRGFKDIKKYNLRGGVGNSVRRSAGKELRRDSDVEVKGNEVFNGDAFLPKKSRDDRLYTAKIAYRLLSLITEVDGRIVYAGIEKTSPQHEHRARVLHNSCARRSIELVNRALRKCEGERFMVVFDEHSSHADKTTHIATTILRGNSNKVRLIEPPYQGDSKLYNSIQAADWVCALLGRIFSYMAEPKLWPRHRAYYERFFPIIEKITFDGSRMEFKAGERLSFQDGGHGDHQPELPFAPEQSEA